MAQVLQYLLSGITVGSIYAVVAIGFNMIYNTTGILNFAQGEFIMLGGMTAVTLSRFMPVPLAILGAVLIVAVCGGILEAVFFRRLRSHSILHMIVITIGLSILVREVALHIWDEKVRALAESISTRRMARAATIMKRRLSSPRTTELSISRR